MTTQLPKRLSKASTSTYDPHYLVHRRLFACLRSASRRARGFLLDIGCGNKPYRELFADVVTEHIGCDVAQSSERVVDIICPSHDIPLANSSVDTVLCTQVIEHVPDPAALIREAYRLLRPGGVLILTGPQYWPLHEEPNDFHRFTKHGFAKLVEAGGFLLEQIDENGGRWATDGLSMLHALPKCLSAIPGIQRTINWLFALLDDRFPAGGNTSNYLVIAFKS